MFCLHIFETYWLQSLSVVLLDVCCTPKYLINKHEDLYHVLTTKDMWDETSWWEVVMIWREVYSSLDYY